jgi:Copper binding periplasmic protein CusF
MGTRASRNPGTGPDQSTRRVGPSVPPKLVAILCVGLVLIAALVWSSQRWGGAPTKPDYRGTGTVVALLPPPSSLHATRPVIIIHHDPIAGLMDEAMSMPFIAASARLLDGLRPGDRIAFGLKTTPEALEVVSIERAKPGRQPGGNR